MTFSPEIFSVSSLSQALKRAVEIGFSEITIQGEVSSAKRHTSGHLYFCLKDEGAIIDSVCWRPQAMRFEKLLEEGAEVLCRGRLTTYPLRSKYQLVIEHVSLTGEGALLKLFEQRKQKLKKEGLFDSDRKKPLPFLPRLIGLITSPTGAVLQDILHRLQDRLPSSVYLWPVNVQGEGASEEVTGAIVGMNQLSPLLRPDVLIVARGGGSAEDLATFNEENIVRAVAASEIPVISAIGHETDTTLIDYAADVRAPTPSAAAEMVVPVRQALLDQLGIQEARLKGHIGRLLEHVQLHLFTLQGRLPQFQTLIYMNDQRFDDVALRLQKAPDPFLKNLLQRIAFLVASLKTPEWLLQRGTFCLETAAQNLERAWFIYQDQQGKRLQQLNQLLQNLSYRKTLERGFCMATSGDILITSVQGVSPEDSLQLHFYDGVLEMVTKSPV
jgi:exodeoxyribonuclease VII large subunit